MAKFYSQLDDNLHNFIREQKIFFTATAPNEGRINLSPKGMDTFRCIDDKTVAYLDLTGSGNETAAHVLENGRMTVMFCSFSEKPLILTGPPGVTGFAGGRPKVEEVVAYWPALIPKKEIEPHVEIIEA